MVGYTYHYDQLNRLKKMRQYTGIAGTGTWDRSYITLNDQENITYDGNGNILTYGRNGGDTTAQTIDSLSYNYNYTGGKLANNQLQYIHDAVSSSGYDLDIRNQTNTNNYQYDPIGNIIKDIQSGITNTGWTVYNKPDTIYKSAGNISYTYNTANQRVSKTYNGLTTWYVRDAQGNVLAVYDNTHGNVNWREQHLYGSSRIGIWTPNINLADSNALDKWDTTGYRQFELDNHLGNVMTTINDVRVPYFKPSHIGPIPGPLQYFTANVLSYQDYYAFGMPMPDRQYTMTGDSSYRYGFNGKENDNEVAGLGNSQDYGERFLDVRIGRFRSVDPIASQYPELSSYQFASNNPIANVDLDGLEGVPAKRQPNGDLSVAQASTYHKPIPKSKIASTPAQVVLIEPTVLMADIHGNGHIGPRSVVIAQVAVVKQEYKDAVGDNIRGGLFGAVGYLAGGDKGSFIGATADGIFLSSSGTNEPVFQVAPEPVVLQEKSATIQLYDPEKSALNKLNLTIPASKNGGAPDFEGSPFLYQPTPGQASIVKIKLTGSYSKDFAAANSAAHLESTPKGFTWHHLDDFNSTTGTGTLQLVNSDVHTATIPHTGSVKQYETANNTTYKP